MILEVEIQNLKGNSVVLNDEDNVFPVRDFQMEVDMRTEERDKSREHGQWPAESYQGKRTIRMEGDILGDDFEDYAQRRIQLMTVLTPFPQLRQRKMGTFWMGWMGYNERLMGDWTLDGHPEISMEALMPARSEYLISLRTFDPRLYGEVLNEVTASLDSEVIGRDFPKKYPESYGATDYGKVTITNHGNMETFLSGRIFGPANNPAIEFYPLGEDVRIVRLNEIDLAEGEYVDIDFARRTVIRNGFDNIFNSAIGSDWFMMDPGDIVVRFTAFWGAAPARVELTWRNAYNP